MTRTQTNVITRRILDFLYEQGQFAWRVNVLPVPLSGGGFRSGGKSGTPDILGVCSFAGGRSGRFLGIEVKFGRDKLRPEQEAFHTQARKLGGLVLVVKSYEDFLEQWQQFQKEE